MNIEEPINQGMADKLSVSVPTGEALEHLFTYHPPTTEDVQKYKDIRNAGLGLARIINVVCPTGPDKSAAIRKVREAVMTANAAVACCGKP